MEYNFMYNKNNGDIVSLEQYTYINREEYEVIRFNNTSYTIVNGYMCGDGFIEAFNVANSTNVELVVFVKTLEDLISYMQSKINVFINEKLEKDNE